MLRRRVSFGTDQSSLEESHKIICRFDYSQDEIEACWYTPEETHKMHYEQGLLVQWMEESIDCEFNSDCRGLEAQTAIGGRDATLRRYCVVDAVMDEQESQWGNDGHLIDWDRFASVSVKASATSKVIAFERAERDHIESWHVYEYERSTQMNGL